MAELLTASAYARQSGIPERTLHGWIQREQPPGVQRVGQAWVAPRHIWDALAAIERKLGRRAGKSQADDYSK